MCIDQDNRVKEENLYTYKAVHDDDILKNVQIKFNKVTVIGQLWALLKHKDQQVSFAALKVLMRTTCTFPWIWKSSWESMINYNESFVDISLLSNVLNLCFPLGNRDMMPSAISSGERCNISICLSFLQYLLEHRPQTISLLSDPFVFYRKCFRYLCHADFFLQVINILKVVFTHVQGSTEAVRFQRAVNDFFSQRTQVFKETQWSEMSVNGPTNEVFSINEDKEMDVNGQTNEVVSTDAGKEVNVDGLTNVECPWICIDQDNREENLYAFKTLHDDDILKNLQFTFNKVTAIGELWTLLKHKDQQVSFAALKVLMSLYFRYLCHADFFVRVLNILKVIFTHVQGSTEAVRFHRAVNDFFIQRTQGFKRPMVVRNECQWPKKKKKNS